MFAALGERQPPGLRYATFRLDDGVTFVHTASVETDDGSNPLDALDEFKGSRPTSLQRCDEPPTVTVATLVGSYRLF